MIYLASASPRRQELLRQLGIEFDPMPSNILEVREAGETPASQQTSATLRLVRVRRAINSRQNRSSFRSNLCAMTTAS